VFSEFTRQGRSRPLAPGEARESCVLVLSPVEAVNCRRAQAASGRSKVFSTIQQSLQSRKDHLTLLAAPCLDLARRGLDFRCVLNRAKAPIACWRLRRWREIAPKRRAQFLAEHAGETRGLASNAAAAWALEERGAAIRHGRLPWL